ncbi:MAG: right-handed parallel beta-helix repeat-containing protein [Deltaproteobacteria bacterium]|nr:right-handed parallel beta-helix repeat-containing protein [Deltaproteobacteria bacterium]
MPPSSKRPRSSSSIVAAVVVAACAACSGDDAGPIGPPECDARALQRALDAAGPGGVVGVGACRVEGALRVPPGVVLQGAGRDLSSIAAGGERVIGLEPGDLAAPTTLRAITIESTARAGVASDGTGSVRVEDVTVRSTRGAAMGLLGLTEATLSDVELAGPVTAANATNDLFLRVAGAEPRGGVLPSDPSECGSVEPTCAPGERDDAVPCDGCGTVARLCDGCGRWVTLTATEGLRVESVERVALSTVSIHGFASFGLVARRAASVHIENGRIEENLGVGILAEDASLDLRDVEVRETLQGFRAIPSYAAFVSRSDDASATTVTSQRLRVESNDAYGLVLLGTLSEHADLVARDNGDVGVWVGASRGFRATGADTLLEGNGLAGLLLSESSGIHVEGATVRGTREKLRNVGAGDVSASVRIGDGIQLAGSFADVTLRDVALSDNARVGLLVELPDASGDITFENVSVARGTGRAGALAGMRTGASQLVPTAALGWDDGILRDADTEVVDRTFADVLDIAAVVAPGDAPIPDDVVSIVGPCD